MKRRTFTAMRNQFVIASRFPRVILIFACAASPFVSNTIRSRIAAIAEADSPKTFGYCFTFNRWAQPFTGANAALVEVVEVFHSQARHPIERLRAIADILE